MLMPSPHEIFKTLSRFIFYVRFVRQIVDVLDKILFGIPLCIVVRTAYFSKREKF